jgi:hypothetical protein
MWWYYREVFSQVLFHRIPIHRNPLPLLYRPAAISLISNYVSASKILRMDGGGKKTPMDQDAKARIMSANAKKPENEGQTKPGTFPARAQSAADKNANK